MNSAQSICKMGERVCERLSRFEGFHITDHISLSGLRVFTSATADHRGFYFKLFSVAFKIHSMTTH